MGFTLASVAICSSVTFLVGAKAARGSGEVMIEGQPDSRNAVGSSLTPRCRGAEMATPVSFDIFPRPARRGRGVRIPCRSPRRAWHPLPASARMGGG